MLLRSLASQSFSCRTEALLQPVAWGPAAPTPAMPEPLPPHLPVQQATTVMTYMALLMLLVAGTSQAIDPRLEAVHRMIAREDKMMGQAELVAARHLSESTVELGVTDLGRLQTVLDSHDMDALATVTGRIRDVHL